MGILPSRSITARGLWIFATIIVGAAFLGLTIAVTGRDDATGLENGLLQFIFFAAGIGFSFVFGRLSVTAAAREMVRRDGKKAIRRIVTLGRGIQSFGEIISQASGFVARSAETNSGMVPLEHVQQTFAILEYQIEGQVRTVVDAIEDWRDIVPDEVNQLDVQAQAAEQRVIEGGVPDGGA